MASHQSNPFKKFLQTEAKQPFWETKLLTLLNTRIGVDKVKNFVKSGKADPTKGIFLEKEKKNSAAGVLFKLYEESFLGNLFYR